MINEVRNSVLTILNKNNYGYISPSDFNLMAANAQMELYEEYFSNYNKSINAENLRTSGTDYADIVKPIGEVLESFLVTDSLISKSGYNSYPLNQFYAPSVTTTGNNAYMIQKILCYTQVLKSGTNTTITVQKLQDNGADFITAGVTVGDIVVNATTFKTTFVVSVQSATILVLNEDIFIATGNKYIIYSESSISEAEKVSAGKITMLNASILTAPSLIYPAYTIVGDIINVYPTNINSYGAINAVYFRYPKVPKWTYTTLSAGEPVFNQSQSDYQDFELPNEDGYKLVTKILEYCGIIIREIEVSQFGSAQQQHEQPTFSMQQ
jgi:hypothetical protein